MTNKNSRNLFYFFIFITIVFLFEIYYITISRNISQNNKLFVSLTGRSDLSFYGEENMIRDRSTTYVFDIFGIEPTMSENSKGSFCFNYSKIINEK